MCYFIHRHIQSRGQIALIYASSTVFQLQRCVKWPHANEPTHWQVSSNPPPRGPSMPHYHNEARRAIHYPQYCILLSTHANSSQGVKSPLRHVTLEANDLWPPLWPSEVTVPDGANDPCRPLVAMPSKSVTWTGLNPFMKTKGVCERDHYPPLQWRHMCVMTTPLTGKPCACSTACWANKKVNAKAPHY